jgi:hypothetical protein
MAALVIFGMQLQVPTVSAFPGGAGSFNASSPTTNVCSSCHSGVAGTGSATVTGLPASYTPGGPAIPLTVTVSDTKFSTWGFQLNSQLASNLSTQAGTFTPGSTTNGSGGMVEGSGSSNSFSFTWTPPATAVGTVNFYLSGLATSSTSNNDLYSATFTLPQAAAATPDFALSDSPTSVSIAQGSSGTSTMTVTPKNGFTGTVSYTASGMPSGVTASFSGNTLTLAASSTATVGGPTTVTITGTSGSLSHTATVGVTVTAAAPAPNFSLSANPTSVSVAQGASGTSTMVVTPSGGFTGAVSYTASGTPSGVTASFSGNTLTLAASSTATVGGPTTVTITGTSGSLSHTATVGVTVTAAAPAPNFSLSANPSSVSVVQGSSGTSTMVVTPSGGFTGTVSYTASGTPSGVTASFSGNTLTLTASGTAAAGGPTTVTITGTSGSLSHTTTVGVTVTASAPAPNFSLSASPSSVTVAPGSSASTTITITPTGGFNAGTVSFSPPGLPTGLSATFGAISSSGTSQLTFNATSSASPMTIGVTITGTAGSLTHTAMVNLTVSGSSTQPALSVTPSTLSFRFSGGSTPSSQKIAIADPPGVVSFTASATGGSWLSVTPGSGSTPGSVTVSVNPSRLSSGTYTGAIQLSATGATGVSVPVTLTVSSSTCIDDCGSGGSGGGSTGSMTAQPYSNDPNSSGTVTSLWIERLGMPTGSQSHDPGLLLSKNTGAPSGTWTGATIRNASGSLTELGYDYRDGGQCTTTSPRFIVVTTDNITHVVGGCSKGTVTSAGMTGWKRVRFNLADTSQTSPAITPGETVSSITLVLDLGPEAGSTAAGGLAVIDNIDVNGTFVSPGSVTRFFSDN